MGQEGVRVPPLHAPVGTIHPPLALHDLILLMNDSATPWNMSACKQGPTNLGAGHGETMPPHWLRRNPEKKSGLKWMGSWVMILCCSQV